MSTVFETILAPEFLLQFFRLRPFSKPQAALDLRKQLNWGRIVSIIQSGHANCWLPEKGALPDRASGRLTPEQAMEGFTGGRTVLIRHSEKADRFIHELAERFENEFSADIDIQLFGTPSSKVGFGWHYDIEEVFIIQSSGTKTYFVRENRDSGPFKDVYAPKSLEDLAARSRGDELVVTLAPGDLLYLPAGTWHTARAETDSWHFSVGLTLRI